MGFATASLGLLAVLPLAVPAGEPAAGEAVVVDLEGRVLEGGDSTTEFTLRLPEGAACQGDSQDDQYRVQSFLVPADADPGSLRYRGLSPDTEDGWGLYQLDTRTFVNQPTAKADQPGGPGAVLEPPGFSFAVFEPGMLPIGRAWMGIACSLWGETTRHWVVAVELRADADDPAGIAWTVVDPPAASSGSAATSGGAAAGVAVVAIGALVVWRRRASARSQVGP